MQYSEPTTYASRKKSGKPPSPYRNPPLAGELKPNESLASFVTLPMPEPLLYKDGPGCEYCMKAVKFLGELQREVLEMFFTLNTTCFEDRLKEKLTCRCRKCDTCYDWFFAAELHRSLDGAHVHVDRVRKKEPDIIQRG